MLIFWATEAKRADSLGIPDIPNLNLIQPSLTILVDVDVDREMGVDVAHLVLKSFGDANDQVVDDGSDGTEGCDCLAGAVMKLDVDCVRSGL